MSIPTDYMFRLLTEYVESLPADYTVDTMIKTKVLELFSLAIEGNKDCAIFLLSNFPAMPDELRNLIWECTRRPAERGRRIDAKADQIWLTIELAKYSGKSVTYGIQQCAKLFDMDDESIKKSWERSSRKMRNKPRPDFLLELILGYTKRT